MNTQGKLSLVKSQEEFPELPTNQKEKGMSKSDEAAPKQQKAAPSSGYQGSFEGIYNTKMWAKACYMHDTSQLIVAAVIFMNFVVVMFSVSQLVIENPTMDETLENVDWCFIAFFLVELVINMGTSCQAMIVDPNAKDLAYVPEAVIINPNIFVWEFWTGDNWAWNWFDFIVIIVPIVMAQSWASSIRILRLFRVVRVLKSIAKFEALQVVASSVSASVSGIGAVAVMIFGLMCCYAIVGVNFFGRPEFKDACAHTNGPDGGLEWGSTTLQKWAIDEGFDNTFYQKCEDYEALFDCFANLRRALYTTFMMMTLESWPDLCWASASVYQFGPIYFVTFVAINALMMANLIIAVFTTRMDKVQDGIKEEQARYTMQRRATVDALSANMGENATIQGIDTDGDGIADEYIIDADGDGIADGVLSADEMVAAQAWVEGEAIEVYSQTKEKWCSGRVLSVDTKAKKLKVEYDVDGSTLGEKTMPFGHKQIRRPKGSKLHLGDDVKTVKMAGMSMKGMKGGMLSGGDTADLERMLAQFQTQLDAISKNVDNLMKPSKKGRGG